MGPFGLEERNVIGGSFVELCLENMQIVVNMWFKHNKRHLWTWKSPGEIVRNQIDYRTINERFRNVVTHAKTIPGADKNSDHLPVMATIRIKLKQ